MMWMLYGIAFAAEAKTYDCLEIRTMSYGKSLFMVKSIRQLL